MKHKIKCIEKKAYKTLDTAEAQVILNFTLGRDTLRIYECPVCLDFHLTKKKPRMSLDLRKRCWNVAFSVWFRGTKGRKSTASIINKNIVEMKRLLPKEYKPKKMKVETLSDKQQKEALERLYHFNMAQLESKIKLGL